MSRRLESLEYYRYECEETFYFSWLLDEEDTGLPVKIMVDEGYAYRMYKHPLWIYFKNGYDKDAELVPLVICDDPYIPYDIPLQIFRKDFYDVYYFVKENQNELRLIANKKYDIDDFMEENIMKVLKDGLDPKKVLVPYIIKVDSKGNPIQDDKEPEFYKVSNGGSGYTIVKNKEDKFNYVDANGNILSEKWFDVAQPFNDRKGKMLAFVKVGVDEYWLSTNGKLKPVEY